MYSKNCNIILRDETEIMSLKLHHLPTVGMIIKHKPLSTGIETEYKVEHVSLIFEEITTTYPGPPVDYSHGWEHQWLIVVEEVVE